MYNGIVEITITKIQLDGAEVHREQIFSVTAGAKEATLGTRKALAELVPSVPRAKVAESDGVPA